MNNMTMHPAMTLSVAEMMDLVANMTCARWEITGLRVSCKFGKVVEDNRYLHTWEYRRESASTRDKWKLVRATIQVESRPRVRRESIYD